ncbi:MAG: HDOD domain-containing protein [Pseudomonadota bacterium]
MALKTNAVQKPKRLEHLPILRHSERGLNELRARTSTSINHLVRIIERDPALAFELFVSANRDLKQAGYPGATNIRRAVLVFGVARYLEHVKHYVAIESYIEPVHLRPTLHHLGRSCASARVAEMLAKLRGGVNPEDAFSLAMAKDIDCYANKLIAASNVGIDLRNARTLLPGLALPPISGDPLQWCTETAHKLISSCEFAWDKKALNPQFEHIAEQLNLDTTEVEKQFVQTIIYVGHETKHYCDFPIARFLLNPRPNAPIVALQFSKGAEKEKTKPQENASKTSRRGAISRNKKPQEKTSKKVLLSSQSLSALSEKLDKTNLDLQKLGQQKQTRPRILPFTMSVFTKLFRAKKALFIAHPKTNQLVARLQATHDKAPKVVKLEIDLAENPVLRKTLKNAEPRHLTARQVKLHEQLFDRTISRFMGENAVYCLPLNGQQKMIGIIIASFSDETTDQWDRHYQLARTFTAQVLAALDKPND